MPKKKVRVRTRIITETLKKRAFNFDSMRGGEVLRQGRRKFPRELPEKGSCRGPQHARFGVMGWSAGARPRPVTVLAATSSASALLVEGLYARCFVFLHIEDGVELRDLQQVMNFLGEVEQLEFATLVLGSGEGTDEFADA